MADTKGIHHLGLAVRNLDDTVAFFVEGLGWAEVNRDDSYPRSFVSDGAVLLTLWQCDHFETPSDFDRRRNVGLHHVALVVESEQKLQELAQRLAAWPGARIEFTPEPLQGTPFKHMMCYEPGGIRLEFIWPGD